MLASRLSVLTTRGLLYRPIPIAPLSSVAAAAAAPSTTSAAPAIETTIKYKFHDKEHNLPADFEKVTVNGKYRLPRLSARQKADVRKRMLVAKALDPQAPSWNPAWDTPNKSVVPRPPKGHRDEHKFKERVDKITASISREFQDKKYADYKKTLPPKPPAEGLIRWVKKSAWEKD